MSHGPLMLDLAGIELSAEDREVLLHPASGGVILFSRNYESPEQLTGLVKEIHGLRKPSLLIAVDQEGGRVQRFREGFTPIPPAAWIGRIHDDRGAREAKSVAHTLGWLMAVELRSVGVDFSFAPVLDIGRGVSSVIGDRAYHASPDVVASLAQAWMSGVREAGMACVGKHFPGHGGVEEDSHHQLPIDRRRFEDLQMEDLVPFQRMIDYGLEAIMPAHVIYSRVIDQLAGFSGYWLQEILRGRLNFQGVIFSDDLTMAAANEAGSYADRAHAALEAGCDMVLVCNNRQGAVEVLESLRHRADPVSQMRLMRMHGRKPVSRATMHLDPRWRKAVETVSAYQDMLPLELDI